MSSGVKCRLGRYAAILAAAGLGVGALLAVTPAAMAATAQAQGRPTGGTSTESEFYGVSCTSASACTAVGDDVTSAGASVMLAERWNGSAWSVQSVPAPSGAAASYLDAVSCTSASACTAVGHYVPSTGAAMALSERWNGSAWSLQSVPAPTGAASSHLYAVSCTSASACTAVGYYQTSIGGATTILAESWNGTAWTIQSIPSPSGALAGNLEGVSCTSATACIAVGWYEPSAGAYETLAEGWNGTAWTIQSTPTP